MDPILKILNSLVASNLSKINAEIVGGIKSMHLDPMGHVAGGTENLGSVDLGVGSAGASASYSINNLTGLSSLQIRSLQITGGGADPNNASVVNGTLSLDAGLGSQLTAKAGGSVEAHLLFVHPSVGISGTVKVTSVTAAATGTFSASTSGGQVCLNKVNLSKLTINYGNASVDIDGLGIFNVVLDPLESVILDAFKGAIRGAVAQALTPVLNTEIGKVLPICGTL